MGKGVYFMGPEAKKFFDTRDAARGTSTTIKFCKDCKYLRSDPAGTTFGKCLRVYREPDYDPVTGMNRNDELWYASTLRMNDQVCGPKGTLWEGKQDNGPPPPKRPWYEIISRYFT